MPRRNNTPKSTRPLPILQANKKRYSTKQQALFAIAEIQKYQPDLALSTYQSPTDSGWYLTSRSEPSTD